MYLPTETLLGRITEQFLIHHLVGRYPLIFGPWRMAREVFGLDREMKYFLPISRSVIDILGRSQNPLIRSRHTRLMKLARHRLDLIFRSSSEAIASHLAEDALEAAAGDYNHHPPAASLSDEDVLCQILEQMYRDGIPQRRPRLTTAYRAFLAHEGDDYDLVNPQDADLFDTNTSASLSLLDEEFADVPFTAVHPSHIYDQDTSSNKVDGHDRKAERLPRDNKTTPSMHAELDHEGMCPAHSPALDTDFSTPSSELLATWVPSTWQDKINPISTPPHHDPLCNAYDECLLASCMDLDPVTRHHPVASHGHKCALPGNNPFEASYLWMWSHHGAHDQPQNPEHLTLDDNSSWASSGDIEILSSPFVDATPVSTVEDIDLSLLDAVDIDDFVADSVETNLAGDSLLQDSLDSDVWFPDETYDPTHAEDPAIHFLADLWDM
ncbi:hypothetical protein ID866_2982 [Astraeus odoratus]|nr:hypothetical protein ID866_2982 [Astraeus odoratus]